MNERPNQQSNREHEAQDQLINWGLRANASAHNDDLGARPAPELADRILKAASNDTPVVANESWGQRNRKIQWGLGIAATLLVAVATGFTWTQRVVTRAAHNREASARSARVVALNNSTGIFPGTGTSAPTLRGKAVQTATAEGWGQDSVWVDPNVSDFYSHPSQLSNYSEATKLPAIRTGIAVQVPVKVSVDGKDYTISTVPETRTRTETYSVTVPVEQHQSYTVQIPEQRTNEQGETYTVMVPETRFRQVIVQKAENRVREVPYTVNVPRFFDENGNAVALDLRKHPQVAEAMWQLGWGGGPELGGDKYDRIHENPFIAAKGTEAVSTFSIDVDTASYSNVRQYLKSGQLPPADAVRLEELVNYFDYDYEGPEKKDPHPFATHTEVAGCPWNKKHRLVRIGIKGREIERDKRPLSNLVFLVDVSGSMNDPNKLPLVVEGLSYMTQELGENDLVSIVVYAGSEGLALPATRGDQQERILEALNRLSAGGSTAGGAGIKLAYKIAEENFIEGGTNRVLLCTDGDFNVGVTSTAELERLAEDKAKETSVFLTVLGFGRGNLNDAMMETISNRGNGTYHYIDNLREARRVLVQQLSGTLVTIAKDVKIQVEFNPANVAGYRLLGYENRMLARQDFNDDTKDAGEVGAGHTVTAIYEVVPAGEELPVPDAEPLKYQSSATNDAATDADREIADPKGRSTFANELLTLRLRYKLPDQDTSTKIEVALADRGDGFRAASLDFRFASSVAGFGMLLRDSEYKGVAAFDMIRDLASDALGKDERGYRAEFLELVDIAKERADSR